MAVNNQFSVAVHIMAGLGSACGGETTSAHVAASVNTSPSFVRRILARLSHAGLIRTAKGKNGFSRLAKDPSAISLLAIYQAVDAPRAFAIHRHQVQKACPVSCQFKAALEKVLARTQKALEASLAQTTLADLIADIRQPAAPFGKSKSTPTRKKKKYEHIQHLH